VAGWVAAALAEGREVPESRGARSYNAELLLRMPLTLHAELAQAAKGEQVSLNAYIDVQLAAAVARTPAGAVAGARGARWSLAQAPADVGAGNQPVRRRLRGRGRAPAADGLEQPLSVVQRPATTKLRLPTSRPNRRSLRGPKPGHTYQR
jgi:hypothetical protein